ncbi:MAG TPA: hypothetical protein ENJ80_15560, partial [Gammaproteobacteria bacterium]|nr:hypothetical protein [Gammaproteobacteria bacterium]
VTENSANGTSVGTVLAGDPDTADSLVYSITAGNTGNAFAINAATGEITVNDVTQLNFETSPVFNLTVQVQDNGTGTLTDTATVTVNLTDLNEVPVINNQSFAVAENSANGTVVGMVSASDPDAADALSYSITAGNTGNAFAIDSATGEITVSDVTQLNFETSPVFNLAVQVQDNGTGTLTDTATVTVNLTDLNEAPVINNQGFTVAENSANGTSVGTVLAGDPDTADSLVYSITAGNTGSAFAINSTTGEITVNDVMQLDFETSPTFNLTVQVQDNGAGTLTDTATVVVNLANVFDTLPAVVVNTGITLAEGASAGIDNTVLLATDSEQPPANVNYTIIDAPLNGRLELVSAPGVAVTGFTQADIDAGSLRYVHDGSDTLADSFSFNVDDGQGNRITEQIFAITVTAVDDTAPVIINNTGAGVDSGGSVPISSAMLSVVDVQPTDNLVYTLTGLPAGGSLMLDGIPLAVNDTFTQGDIDAGRLVYQHLDAGVAADAFSFNIDDGMGNQVASVAFEVSVNIPLALVQADVDYGDGVVLPPPVTAAPGVLSTPPAVESGLLALETLVPLGGGSHGNPELQAAGAEPESTALPVVQVSAPDRHAAPETVSEPAPVTAVNEAPPVAIAGNSLSDTLWLSLNRMHSEMDGGAESVSPWVLAATRSVVWTFSAGFLAWVLRAGSLLAAAMSSMPMWRWVDPLPILPVRRRERDKRKAQMQNEAEAEAKAYSGMADILDEHGEDGRR